MGRISRDRSGVRTLCRALILLTGVSALFGCEGQAPESPNLVLISVDRLATDRLGCFGGEADAGGSICALGKGGTLFAWAISSNRAEASGAATILTGEPEALHGVGRDGQSFLADRKPSVAEDLAAAGYATAAFVASPRVNRSRRLDQGFDLYDDRLGSPSRSPDGGSVELSDAVQSWIETAPPPWFVWIHADRDDGIVELDRLFSRLSQTFAADRNGPGVLFVGLRGESDSPNPSTPGSASAPASKIGWRTHRIPLVWRPPTRDGIPATTVSLRLASLIDVAPTLRAAAGAADPNARASDSPAPPGPQPERGRDLMASSPPGGTESAADAHYVVIDGADAAAEVGLASTHHLYARLPSPLDGTGRAVPTAQLRALEARFMSLPWRDATSTSAPASARIDPPRWRTDVLDSESPVPQLEFHLARGLGALDTARRVGVRREPKEPQ